MRVDRTSTTTNDENTEQRDPDSTSSTKDNRPGQLSLHVKPPFLGKLWKAQAFAAAAAAASFRIFVGSFISPW